MRILLICFCFCFIFSTIALQSLVDHYHYTSESCVHHCHNENDCDGQLFCNSGRCTDDPGVGTHICKKGGRHGDVHKDDGDGDKNDGDGGEDKKDDGDSDDDQDDGDDSGGEEDSKSSGGGDGVSSCGGSCKTENDCQGKLICINHISCGDDPDLGTHICSARGGGGAGGKSSGSSSPRSTQKQPSSRGSCQASGKLQCGGKSYPQFSCSPPIQAYTEAVLTFNDFSEGGDGGSESECDSRFHRNSELIVALSTGWYNGGTRCGLFVIIKSKKTGMSVKAKVVDECDSRHGCDHEHAGQPPCKNNIVDASKAVWEALHLNTETGTEGVLWAMA